MTKMNEDIYIAFFVSNDNVSKIIKRFEKFFMNKKFVFTHVGICIKTDIIKDLIPCKKNIYPYIILESTFSGPLNDNVKTVCDDIFFGVQMRWLNEIVQEYKKCKKCMIAISKIKNLPNDYINILRKSIVKYINKNYDKTIVNLLTIHIPIPSIKTDGMFCSELVCNVLKDLHIIDDSINDKKVSPNSIFKVCNNIEDPIFIVY